MDPLSVAASVTALGTMVLQLSSSLYVFVDATRKVDNTVNALYAEVNGLIQILNTIGAVLRTPTLAAQGASGTTDDTRGLWQAVYGSLTDCRDAVENLEKTLQSVKMKGQNVVQQMIRQFRLTLKEDDINALRSQFKTHNMALQIALQTINLYVSSAAPVIVIADLSPKIDLLVQMIARLDSTHGQAILGTRDALRSIDPLKLSARKVLSSAATVVEAGSTVHGSVYGSPLSFEKQDRISTWIPLPTVETETSSSTSLSNMDFLSSARAPHDALPMRSHLRSSDKGDMHSGSDSDNDVEVELIEKLLAKAKVRYAEGNYAEAAPLLRRVLQRLQRLPMKRRKLIKMQDLELKLAMSLFRLGKLKEAEELLFAVTNEHAVATEDAERILSASHFLAEFQLEKGDCDAAERYCQKAMIGRRRTLGKEHISYYESLELLSRICEGKGDSIEAGAYIDMIPSKVLSSLKLRRVGCMLKDDIRFKNADSVVRDRSVSVARTPTNKVEMVKSQLQELKCRLTEADKQLVVEALILRGYSMTHTDWKRSGPLPWAIRHNNALVVLYLAQGFDVEVDARNILGIKKPRKRHIVAPLNPCVPEDEIPLVMAIKGNRKLVAAILLEQGALVEGRVGNTVEWTALITAAKQGNDTIVQLLLEHGADPKTCISPDGESPLHEASREGHESVVLLLLNAGADIESVGWSGMSPLAIAAHNGKITVVGLLLARNAQINSSSWDRRWTPLDFAREFRYREVEHLLIKHGAVSGRELISPSQDRLIIHV